MINKRIRAYKSISLYMRDEVKVTDCNKKNFK